MNSISPVAASAYDQVQSNSLDAITDFGGEQVDSLPEHIRVKRDDQASSDTASAPQITY